MLEPKTLESNKSVAGNRAGLPGGAGKRHASALLPLIGHEPWFALVEMHDASRYEKSEGVSELWSGTDILGLLTLHGGPPVDRSV
jgi:hypothetical protein